MSDLGYLIVARCTDGFILRGTSEDFRPDRFFFHVFDSQSLKPERVLQDQLKAVFFVKSLHGKPDHVERKLFGRGNPSRIKVWVRFTDGEEFAGWTDEYDPAKPGFYLYPVDPDSNIHKAWIPFASPASVLLNEDAELAARAFKNIDRNRRRRITPQNWDLMLSIEPADVLRANAEHKLRVQDRLRQAVRRDKWQRR